MCVGVWVFVGVGVGPRELQVTFICVSSEETQEE